MNSITAKLSAGSIVATLRMMRSARKEIILIVEGNDDVILLSQMLKLPRSNFLTCNGKKRMMEVFAMAPAKGLDSGTILIRDADFDGVKHQSSGDVHLVVTDDRDLEMMLMKGRIFSRIFAEYARTKATPGAISQAFDLILNVCAVIGAARKHSADSGIGIDFGDMNLRFICVKSMEIDIEEMVRYLVARSGLGEQDLKQLSRSVEIVAKSLAPIELAVGKDFIRVLSLALSRHLRFCPVGECSEAVLSRMLRVAAVQDDLRPSSLYRRLAGLVNRSAFAWQGAPL